MAVLILIKVSGVCQSLFSLLLLLSFFCDWELLSFTMSLEFKSEIGLMVSVDMVDVTRLRSGLFSAKDFSG